MAALHIGELQTGDLILYNGQKSLFSRFVEFFTGSRFSHVAVVLREPTYLHPSLTGIYAYQAAPDHVPDVENGNTQMAVKLKALDEDLRDYKGTMYARRVDFDRSNFIELVRDIYAQTHGSPYDTRFADWVRAALRDNPTVQTQQFFCSALVAYFLMKLGLLVDGTKIDNVYPGDFGGDSSYLVWTDKLQALGPLLTLTQ